MNAIERDNVIKKNNQLRLKNLEERTKFLEQGISELAEMISSLDSAVCELAEMVSVIVEGGN